MENYHLYCWDFSVIDGNTAYFYFKKDWDDKLLMVEYWVDEEKVSPIGQFYTEDGMDLEEGVTLTQEEQDYFLNICKKTIV